MGKDLNTSTWGGNLTITGTPARHGPTGIEPIIDDVIGFVLSVDGSPNIYITGDTVWYEGLEPVAQRFDIGLVVLHAGAAQPRGPFNVTMDTNDAIEAASRFKGARSLRCTTTVGAISFRAEKIFRRPSRLLEMIGWHRNWTALPRGPGTAGPHSSGWLLPGEMPEVRSWSRPLVS